MNRRAFFGLLASVPFLRRLAPAAPSEVWVPIAEIKPFPASNIPGAATSPETVILWRNRPPDGSADDDLCRRFYDFILRDSDEAEADARRRLYEQRDRQ